MSGQIIAVWVAPKFGMDSGFVVDFVVVGKVEGGVASRKGTVWVGCQKMVVVL